MAVKFFRLTIKSETEAPLLVLKDWFLTQITQSDLHETIGDGSINVSDDLEGNFVLTCDMYLLPTKDLLGYKDLVTNKVAGFSQKEKKDIISVEVIAYENCSHDEPNPQPCVPETLISWVR